MKYRTILLGGLIALALAAVATAADEVTLEGSFVWARDDGERIGPLTAVMTPDGDNQGRVAFHFTWDDEPHVYLGRATGTLGRGDLEGNAESDNPDHPLSFRFRGEFSVEISGMPLGSMRSFPYEARRVELEPGDAMLLMSDGFPELLDPRDEMLGYERAGEIFASVAARPAAEIVERLVTAGDAWRDGRDPDDDITFVVLKRRSPAV